MRRFVLPLTFLSLALFVSVAHAQRKNSDRVQRRLDEVRVMMEEEQGTIDKLERQLKDAIDRDENALVDELREKIDSAFDRLDRLKELREKLDELMDSASGNDEDARPRPKPARGGSRRGKPRVPNPVFGGMEPTGDRDGFGRDDEAEDDRDGRSRSPDRDRGRDRGRDRDRDDDDRSGDSRRLRHLRDALDSLTDAGEFGLARSVEQLIRREENRLRDAEPERGRDRSRDDDEEGSRRRPSGRDRSDDDDSGPRTRGSGPIEVDGPAPSRRGGKSRRGGDDDQRDRDIDDELEDVNDELERIREKGDG